MQLIQIIQNIYLHSIAVIFSVPNKVIFQVHGFQELNLSFMVSIHTLIDQFHLEYFVAEKSTMHHAGFHYFPFHLKSAKRKKTQLLYGTPWSVYMRFLITNSTEREGKM